MAWIFIVENWIRCPPTGCWLGALTPQDLPKVIQILSFLKPADSIYGALLIGGEQLFRLKKSIWSKIPVNQSFFAIFFQESLTVQTYRYFENLPNDPKLQLQSFNLGVRHPARSLDFQALFVKYFSWIGVLPPTQTIKVLGFWRSRSGIRVFSRITRLSSISWSLSELLPTRGYGVWKNELRRVLQVYLPRVLITNPIVSNFEPIIWSLVFYVITSGGTIAHLSAKCHQELPILYLWCTWLCGCLLWEQCPLLGQFCSMLSPLGSSTSAPRWDQLSPWVSGSLGLHHAHRLIRSSVLPEAGWVLFHCDDRIILKWGSPLCASYALQLRENIYQCSSGT